MAHPIYLDYNATTPLDPAVVAALLPYLEQHFGNPSSGHAYGQAAREAVEQAREQLQAICAVRGVQVIRAAGRDPERLRAFCEEMSAEVDVPVTPVADVEAAVRDADIVITATSAKEPVLLGDWLKPGAHVNVMGSNWANRREVDERTIERSDLLVIDSKEQGILEAGDLLLPIQQGRLGWERVHELHEVVAGAIPGRQSAEEITLFKSLGLALEDIAVAERIYTLALERGVGAELDFLS